MRKPRSAWRIVVATAVALVTCVQLAVAAGDHDVLHHDEADTHACVICTFTQAQEVGEAVLAELVAPLTGEAELAGAEPVPHTAAVVVTHPARGPPAPRA